MRIDSVVILSEFNRKPPDKIEVYRGIKIIGPKCILELLSSLSGREVKGSQDNFTTAGICEAVRL